MHVFILGIFLFLIACPVLAQDDRALVARIDKLNQEFKTRAEASLTELLQLQKTLESTTKFETQLKLLHVLCDLYDFQGLNRELLSCSLKAIDVANKIEDFNSLAIFHNTAGNCYEIQSDYVKAKEYYIKALGYSRKFGNKSWEVVSLKNLATVQERMGDASEGLRLLKEAFQLAQALTDRNLIANVLNQTADLYMNLNRLEKAQEYFAEAFKLYQDLGDEKASLVLQVNLANAYLRGGQLDQAEQTYLSAIDNARKLNLQATLGHSWKGLARIAADRGDIDRAMQLFQKSLEEFARTGETMAVIVVKNGLAKLLIKKSRYSEAKALLQEVAAAFAENQLIAESSSALKELAGVQFELKEYQDAYQSLGRAFESYKNVNNEQSLKATTELKVKFDTDYQEAQNKILALTNEHQKEQLRNQRILLLLVALVLLGLSLFVYFIMKKSRIIRKQAETISMILANIEQGILLLDSELHFQGETPAMIYRLLPGLTPNPQLHFETLAAALELDKHQTILLMQSLEAAKGGDELQWELNSAHLPHTVLLSAAMRTIEIEWKPIFSAEGLLQRIMIVLRDVTQRLHLEGELQQEHQHNKIVLSMLRIHSRDPQGLADFMRKALATMRELQDLGQDAVGHRPLLLQKLHTLKGNCRTLEFSAIAESVHEAETCLQDLEKHGAWAQALGRVDQEIQSAVEIYRQSFVASSRSRSPRHRLLAAEMAAVSSMIDSMDQAGVQWQRLVFENRPTHAGSELIEVLTDVMGHAVSNAVDHGYIRPLEQKRSQDRELDLEIVTHEENGVLSIAVTDAGAGLDENQIRRIAEQRGFVPKLGQSVFDVLLESEVSTANTVTKTSGRGVGTTAMRSLVETHGGRIRIFPAAQRGTTLELTLPLSSELSKHSS